MKIKTIYRLAGLCSLIGITSACQLWAVITSSPDFSLGQDSVLVTEELEFLQSQTSGNNNLDGWALLYYSTGQMIPDTSTQLWRSPYEAWNDSLFDTAQSELISPEHSVHMAQGHIRQASSGALEIPDPHPFLYEWNDHLLSFSHNGSLDKIKLLSLLTDFGTDSTWILAHPPDTYGCGDWQTDGWECVIDSQLYFYWLVRNIETAGDLLTGIENGLTLIEDPLNPGTYLPGAKNFTLLDGESIYAYRSAQGYYSHKLFYSDATYPLEAPYSDLVQHHQAVMTKPPVEGPASAMDWIWMDNGTLIRLRTGEAPLVITGLGTDLLPGDMNEDNAVDILDVIWLVFIIVDNELPSDYELWAGDITHDGSLDITDVTWLVSIILYF